MKKILLYILTLFAASFTFCFAACDIDTTATLQDFTKPYITRYECTQAILGGDDLLKDYDYIRITILDDKEMELSFREKDGKARAKTFGYTYDSDNGEIVAEESALGVKIKERVVIKDGAFTISLPIDGRQLILKFEKE